MKMFFLFTFILLTSCKSISFLKNQKIVSIENCVDMRFVNKNLIVTSTLEKSSDINFMFDTGAMGSMIKDTTVVPDFYKKKSIFFGKTKGANNILKNNKLVKLSIQSKLFSSDNKVFAYIEIPKSRCYKKNIQNYEGIAGVDMLFENGMLLNLNFTENKICNIKSGAFDSIINLSKVKYRKIKSACYQNQIFIFFKVNNIEYKFKMDTGFIGTIIMPKNDKLNIQNLKSTEFIGSLYSTSVGATSTNKELFYDNVPIDLGGNKFNSAIAVSSSIKSQNIGLEFIKGFDWIIDYDKNNVLIRKNLTKIDEKKDISNLYYCKIENEQLVISVKETSQTRFNLGDKILSVNSELVTSENICETQKLLNNTFDWNNLSITIDK